MDIQTYLHSQTNIERLRGYNEALRKVKDEDWAFLVATSKSKVEVAKKAGVSKSLVLYHVDRLNLDTSHFIRPTHRRTLNEILVVNSSFTHTGHLKEKLIAAKLKEDRCEECGLIEWQGKYVSKELHHINGNYRDNRLDNLLILCPNCHSQTPNYGQANRGRGRPR